MSNDWPQIKARLERLLAHWEAAAFKSLSSMEDIRDLRAALQRESEMSRERDAFVKVLDPEDRNVVSAMVNARALLQRVEELEREKYGTPCKCEEWIETSRKAEERAEAAERELADTKKHLQHYMGRTAQAEAKLAKWEESLQREKVSAKGE